MEKETEKKRFHITITDNATGETLLDTDSGAIIGGVSSEKGCHLITFTECGPGDMAETLALTEDAVHDQYVMHPELVTLVAGLKSSRAKQKTAETETAN